MPGFLRYAVVGMVLGTIGLVLASDAARAGPTPATEASELTASDLFQWYGEFDEVDYYAHPPAIEQAVPRGRVAVIDFVTFQASDVQCPLIGVGISTTFRNLGSLHTIVGVVDLGPTQQGRRYGLSQPAKVYVDGGSHVNVFIKGDVAGPCAGNGADLTVTGHFVPRR